MHSARRALNLVPPPIAGAALALVCKGMGLLVQIVVVVLAMKYMGKEQYGVLAIVLSLGALSQFADVGLSQPLVNFAAEVSARAMGLDELRRYASTAFFGMIAIAFIGIGLTSAIFFVPMAGRVLGVPLSGQPALAAVVTCYLISLPFATAAKLQTGFQQYFSQYLFQFGGSLVALGLLWWVTSHKLPLLAIVLAIQCPVALATAANWIFFHRHSGSLVSPNPRLFSRCHFKRLLTRGAMPIVSQIASAVIYVAPVWSIGKLFGLIAAGSFYTPYRLLSPVPIACGLATAPLWPAYAEAWSAGDRNRVRAMFGRSILLGMSFTVIGLCGILVFIPGREAVLIALWFAAMVVRQLLTTAILGVGGARLGLWGYCGAVVAIGALGASGHLLQSETTVMGLFIGLEVLLILMLSKDLSECFRNRHTVSSPSLEDGIPQGQAIL